MKNPTDVRNLAFISLMLAASFILTALESMLPPLPFAPPGIRLGLSNVVTMYVLFFAGKKHALLLIVMKSVFVALTRGPFPGLLSATGGIVSILVLILLLLLSKRKSYIFFSSMGAIAHNIGQIAAASLLLSTNLLAVYWPFILIFGITLGCITGKILEIVIPYLSRHRIREQKSEIG